MRSPRFPYPLTSCPCPVPTPPRRQPCASAPHPPPPASAAFSHAPRPPALLLTLPLPLVVLSDHVLAPSQVGYRLVRVVVLVVPRPLHLPLRLPLAATHIFFALADDLLWLVRFQSRSRIERAARRALPRAAALRRQRLRGRARLYCLLPPAHAEVLALVAVAALPIAAKWPVEQLWGTVVHREMYLQSTINWQLQPDNCITGCYC